MMPCKRDNGNSASAKFPLSLNGLLVGEIAVFALTSSPENRFGCIRLGPAGAPC